MSLKHRLAQLEGPPVDDVVLFDRDGKVLLRWHPSLAGPSGVLACYMAIARQLSAGDQEMLSIVRTARSASANFGRLHEVLAATLEDPERVMGTVQ